jgi:hypothetical protein
MADTCDRTKLDGFVQRGLVIEAPAGANDLLVGSESGLVSASTEKAASADNT